MISNLRAAVFVSSLLALLGKTTAGCCSQNYMDCDVSHCGTSKNQCLSCNGDQLIWLENGPQSSCTARWDPCTNNLNDCCNGLSCVGNQFYRQCLPTVGITPTAPPNPTLRPTPRPTLMPTKSPTNAPTPNLVQTPTRSPTKRPTRMPTKSPTNTPTPNLVQTPTRSPTKRPTRMPTKSPTNAPTPNMVQTPTRSPTKRPTNVPTTFVPTENPNTNRPTLLTESVLLRSDKGLNAWEIYQGLSSLTHINSENPPNYAFVASGGAAGDGSYVVSESQSYALLITGVVLASWEEHAGKVAGANRAAAIKSFEGYFNFWKNMCVSSSQHDRHCQNGGNYCSGSVCLPDWKHWKTGGSVETGAAPDADEDAIVGIILAVSAVANDISKPMWYDEARSWADASSTAFFRFNVDSSKSAYRMVKLGSCWGGWDNNGNNPSYHSPGSYRIMRDFQQSYDGPRNGYNAVSQSEWNGGSGTPQYQYGAEASRTTFRVAMDAAFYPESSLDWSPYLSAFHWRLKNYFDPQNRSWPSNTFQSCRGPNTSQDIQVFGDWSNNAFIYGPTYTSLIAASPSIQNAQSMIDAAANILKSNLPSEYFARSWTLISSLVLSGAMENAAKKFHAHY
ncbi:laminin G domain containing protein [Nitzschia inconspicua]|uniref:Laminin G domain containing protein n=1 Tax=Nitzschia inconspicua TaxID=303405 RepID=A0A9K3PLU1_9STRA|nr:laminin G domain containing protein [Nitzschia inconspicua]